MQRLSCADASFVYGQTPGSHLHLGTLAVLAPLTAPDGIGVERRNKCISPGCRCRLGACDNSSAGLDHAGRPTT